MLNASMCIQLYTFIQALIFKHKYITGDHMLILSNIFIELKYSILVSNLYGLMQHKLGIIYVALSHINWILKLNILIQ